MLTVAEQIAREKKNAKKRAKNAAKPKVVREPRPRAPRIRPSEALTVDEIAVESAVMGYRVPLNLHERRAAFVILESRGLLDEQIARKLGCTERTVQRYRRRNELGS